MQNDAHARANAEQLGLLLEDLELTAVLSRPGDTAHIHPADLTPIGIADQLARMYEADHGQSDDMASAEERTVLADYLGCHEEVRAEVWAAWAAGLSPLDWYAAQYWLDVEFVEPCPEHQP
ncbi:hypothetical protein [Deinococcus humi]|uniref:Uncharacterized protein n=1 Tax=Deinococcus humi TaxID=662880 RepID=A0A7W8JZ96_9DEIO|nr:hypothetical protein [Deinococcus humi]MBB5365960.1 hypothetical protein [Deinococcus humi]